jgi:hypothetical protein
MTDMGNDDPIRTLAPNTGLRARAGGRDAMTQLDRTVWTAPVRNLVWVAARFGHR